MTDIIKLAWGISPLTPKHIAWGARSIFQRDGKGKYQIDIVWDRQEMVGGTEEERKQFAGFIKDWGVPMCRKLVDEYRVGPSDDSGCAAKVGDWEVTINPRRSHGYLYIGIWPSIDGMPQPYAPPPVGKVKDAKKYERPSLAKGGQR